MALFVRVNKLIFSLLVIILLCNLIPTYRAARLRRYTPPSVPLLTDLFPRVSIADSFTDFFGASHIKINGSKATLSLDKTSGSGLASKNKYFYGFFSASIKLPSGLSPGVVVAFYMSNADVHPHNHDEIDIELLGHDKRKDWAFQTNIYANGSVSTGREEKFYLWFDPTLDHHQYTILWNQHHIVFLVDNIPVREFRRNAAYPSVFPAKPMSVYATIWDGSTWATHGGKYAVNYKYAPFVVSLTDAQISGAVADPTSKGGPTEKDPVQGPEFSVLSDQQVAAMDWARRKLMFYSYCKDISRFKVMPPECK